MLRVLLLMLFGVAASLAADSRLPKKLRMTVFTEKTLQVASGRTAALTSEHLRIKVRPQLGTSCRVTVRHGGSFSERVGKIAPHAFSCAFATNGDQVVYSHSGSPLLLNDSISLRIFAFSSNLTDSPVIRDVTINVQITTKPIDKLVLFGGTKKSIEVVLSGLSEDFDRLRMAFSYEITDNVSCTLSYNATSGLGPFPAKGHLVDRLGNTLDSFTVDCWEFAFSGMRYQHLKPFSPVVDYIPMTARVVDGKAGRVVEEENVYVPVKIIGAMENYPPQLLASSALKLTLKSPYLTLFTSEVLSFVDWDVNDVSRLLISISRQPPESLGYFVNLLRPTERINSFTIGDLDGKLIAFQPAPEAGSDTIGSGESKFIAYDDLFALSEEVTVQISLAYSSTNFPRARVRESLYVLKGLPQPVTTRSIELLTYHHHDKESSFKKPQIRRIYFEDPKCGTIVRETKQSSTSFSLQDLENGAVVYNQTNYICSSDFVICHIQDDFVELRLGLPVYFVPRSIEPPILVRNKPFTVRQALQHVLNRKHLLAVSSDNSTQNRCRTCVTYRVVKQPSFGSLESSSNASLGSVLMQFTQMDVDNGFIRYQHSGDTVQDDELVLRLEDDDTPTQHVGREFEVEIKIRPYSPEKISKILSNSNIATLNESDFLILTENHLKYKYPTASDRDIEYVVVKPPYFLENGNIRHDDRATRLRQKNGDAGKLVIFSSGNMPSRRSSEQIVSFTQNDVKDGRVAYFAPNSDIGARARVAQFVFDVKGPEGVAKSQVFKINILPINNRPPRVHETTLTIKAGASVALLPAVKVDDADSPVERLTIAIEQTPKHGKLVVNGSQRLSLGDKIELEELGSVSYQHDSTSADRVDQFRLQAFDGQYHSSGTISVSIQQPDILDRIFVSNVTVEENDQVELILPEARDFISSYFKYNSSMKFLVVRPPFSGKLLLNGKEIRKFYTRDLLSQKLIFTHPLQAETGVDGFKDSLTILGISSSNDLLVDSHQLLLRTISVNISPKDNRAPVLEVVGLPQIFEGHSIAIDSLMIRADDVDTPNSELRIELITEPTYGCLLARDNEECMLAGDSIAIDDRLVYNHTDNRNNEATRDSFDMRASDKIHFSHPATVTVEILPETDEIPTIDVTSPKPVIKEGGEIDLAKLFTIHDLDRPADNLTLIFTKFPEFGKISASVTDGDKDIREVIDGKNNKSFTISPQGQQPIFVYKHDGSENLTDWFEVKASDPKFTSLATLIEVEVTGIDDEKPRLVRSGTDGEILRFISPDADAKTIKLTTSDLMVYDLDTLPSEISFSLTRKPRQLTLVLDNVMATSFTQADIDDGKISLMLPNIDFKIISDSFRLTAKSGQFEISDIALDVVIIKENSLNLSVALNSENINKTLALPFAVLDQLEQNNFVFITSVTSGDECFWFSDSSFTLANAKAGGVRILTGKNYAPAHYCHQLIKLNFTHLPSKTLVGSLLVNFTLLPEPEKKPEPQVSYRVVKRPGIIERLAKRVYGFVMTTEHLHTTSHFDDDTKRRLDDAVYEISRNPAYGILADLSTTSSSLASLKRFTQSQVDAKQIVYVLTKLVKKMTNDSFVFSVTDGMSRQKIVREPQSFNVEWSFVEFEQDRLIGCESNGHITVPIRRVGFINSSAAVHVRLRHSHARDGQRHRKMEAIDEELKFEPGSSKLVLNVKLAGEMLQPNRRSRPIRALLRSPVNTLLGSSRKVSIRVIASDRPPCSNKDADGLVNPVESEDNLPNSHRIFSLRSKILSEDNDRASRSQRPARSNKACQTGWTELNSVSNTCYTQLPVATRFWDAHQRCKALGGWLPNAATMSPALLHELSNVSSQKSTWINAPNIAKKSKKFRRRRDHSRSCAIIRNMAIAIRRCAVAKARVICLTDL